ncbi:auxin-binding protein ABP19b-like [Chenopodium quinoa]|uniref:auxin-binding protein ABP19b-like n=1 Tax=Chenopodium quinoa TaxID=63459 RepID=UPI000B7747A3|nr:auxin-binding protein ABP19b-like [Chenopodium quinoa]
MELQKNFFFVFLFISLTYSTSVVDFCVADLKLPSGPAGYPCRNPADLTVDDFTFSGLATPGNGSNIFKLGISEAFDVTFPAVNGLGISVLRADLGVGGVVPLHSHRVTELIYMVEGSMITGFINTDNKPYFKTLNKGDIMIIPQGSYHFSVNNGTTPAVATATFNSANPGIHIATLSIAANNLPTDLIQKITLLDTNQIHELKKIFGGTN